MYKIKKMQKIMFDGKANFPFTTSETKRDC